MRSKKVKTKIRIFLLLIATILFLRYSCQQEETSSQEEVTVEQEKPAQELEKPANKPPKPIAPHLKLDSFNKLKGGIQITHKGNQVDLAPAAMAIAKYLEAQQFAYDAGNMADCSGMFHRFLSVAGI